MQLGALVEGLIDKPLKDCVDIGTATDSIFEQLIVSARALLVEHVMAQCDQPLKNMVKVNWAKVQVRYDTIRYDTIRYDTI